MDKNNPWTRAFRPTDDAFHSCTKPGAWTWWYFDAHFDNDYLMAGTFHFGSPRPPADGDARFIEVALYDPTGDRRMVRKRFSKAECQASEETCRVTMGKNTIEGALPKYHVFYSEKDQGCDLTYESSLEPYIPIGEGLDALPFDADAYAPGTPAGWVIVQPRARVTGTITWDGEEIEVTGMGYRDQNFLQNPVSGASGVENTFWTKFFIGDWTLIIDAGRMVRKKNHAPMGMAIIYQGEKIVGVTRQVGGVGSDYVADKSGIDAPRIITIRFDDPELIEGEIKLGITRILEFMDLHSRFKPFQRWYAETFVGKPAYRRYRYDFDLALNITGEKVVSSGNGWCEHHKIV